MRSLAGELTKLCQNKLLDAAAVIIMGRGQEHSAGQSGRVRLGVTLNCQAPRLCNTPTLLAVPHPGGEQQWPY